MEGRTAVHIVAARGLRGAAAAMFLNPGSLFQGGLHISTYLCHRVISKIGHGADLSLRNADGETALHSAAKGGIADVLLGEVVNHVDVNSPDDLGNTPLHHAAMCIAGGDRGSILALLDRGADAWRKNKKNQSPLRLAIERFSSTNDILYLILRREMQNNESEKLNEALILIMDRTLGILKNRRGDTLLNIAVANGDVEMVSILLQYGCDPRTTDVHGRTALHVAVRDGNFGLVDKLLGCSSDLGAIYNGGKTDNKTDKMATIEYSTGITSITDNNGDTALHVAVSRFNKNHDIVKLLLEHQKNGTSANKIQEKALKRAIQMADLTTVELVINSGVDINAVDDEGQSLLMHAAMSGDVPKVEKILNAGADVNKRDREGFAALHIAVTQLNENPDILKLLLEHQAHATLANQIGDTPLKWALQKADLTIVELMINSGVDIDAVDDEGQTLLMHAVMSRDVAKVKKIINVGVDVNMRDRKGFTALHIAVTKTEHNINYDILKLLSEHRADSTLENQIGDTPLKWALKEAYLHPTTVKLLINSAVNINVADEKGQTLLIHAAMSGDVVKVDKILSAGADVNMRDKDGFTALHHATSGYIVNALLRHGAYCLAQSNDGSTPLHCAIKNMRGRFVIEALLLASRADDRKDNDGKTAFDCWSEIMLRTPFTNFCNDRYMELELYFVHPMCDMVVTLALFKAAGIMEDIIKKVERLPLPSTASWKTFGEYLASTSEVSMFSKEMNKIRATSVKGISLYSILSCKIKEPSVLGWTEVKNTIDKNSFASEFKYYHRLIRIGFEQAQAKHEMSELQGEVLELFSDSQRNILKLNISPEVIIMIFKCISLIDLMNMKAALPKK